MGEAFKMNEMEKKEFGLMLDWIEHETKDELGRKFTVDYGEFNVVVEYYDGFSDWSIKNGDEVVLSSWDGDSAAPGQVLAGCEKVLYENPFLFPLPTIAELQHRAGQMRLPMKDDNEISDAALSPDKKHRYALYRRWSDLPIVVWLGLNPSTADENTDDPTIRRIVGFSKAWGYGAVVVLNLFSLRSTDPRNLLNDPNPEGEPLNDAYLRSFCAGQRVIVAWGNRGICRFRAETVLKMLSGAGSVECLGITKTGCPMHPLYLPRDRKPMPFPEEKCK